MEIWKEIKGYEGLYAISNLGRVKRLISFKCKVERFLKPHISTTGYYFVGLYKDAFGRNIKIHRLIATHFIDNPNNLPFINHKDGDKLNNSIQNLEWVTAKENCNHAKENNLHNISGSKHFASILTEEKVLEIRKNYPLRKTNVIKFAASYGIAKPTLMDIMARKRWAHI